MKSKHFKRDLGEYVLVSRTGIKRRIRP